MSEPATKPTQERSCIKQRAQTAATKFDLEERTARLGESVIALARSLKCDAVNEPLISQVVRSATSVGANYAEANGTQTRKDFKHRIGICLRECKETQHWLRMLAQANETSRQQCRSLWQEAHELTLIFGAIVRSMK